LIGSRTSAALATSALHGEDSDSKRVRPASRRARQYEGITTLQLFDGAGGGCRPIANALGFIEDDQVRTHVVHIFDVLQDELVTAETEEGRVGVELLAMRQQPVNDLCGKITELLNLRLPLVFDGSGLVFTVNEIQHIAVDNGRLVHSSKLLKDFLESSKVFRA